ncbi:MULTISPECIES: tyrosine-type recombinase/integrase [Terrabacteria group]|uniref:tyrosine-type recombinase/integrase n=1 Tax=Bacillati TaxID=1783272 RepID=UPI001C6EB9C8|nr:MULTISPECIES: tyrosine-type recombinase/integrase [Terrabacteria group]MBW9212602.1 tyrosine-type recombinase/integrase [Trueperella sp. zg.1013]
MHDFRHNCAGLLINNRANVTVVAKYLGHANIEQTPNTYSHMFVDRLDEVVDKLNEIAKNIIEVRYKKPPFKAVFLL